MTDKITPLEIIRLGTFAGHEPDVILASLEAAGWQIVPASDDADVERVARAIYDAIASPEAGDNGHLGTYQANAVFDEEQNETDRRSTTIDGRFDLTVIARAAMLAARPK